jgi:glutamate/tyrosine decarboxylase-like PLP-dependent enzyme
MSTAVAYAAADAAPLREAFAGLAGIDGAPRPGADALVPAGPRVVSRRDLVRLGRTAERLWAAHDAEVRRALERGAEPLARSLGFTPEQSALVAATPSWLAPPVRADFVPTKDGYRLVEWNVDPCLGGLAGKRLFECFARAGVAHGLDFRDPAEALVPCLARLRGEVRGVSVLIRERDRAAWGTNAERIVEVARQAGLQASVVPLERFACEAAAPGVPPLGVLRLFHIEHVPWVQAEVARLLRAAAEGRVRLVYGFDTELWGDKQWLARTRLPPDLARSVPETHPVRDVRDALLGDRAAWVLKPHAGAAGEGVTIGRELGDAPWRAAVQRAMQEPGWIAQRLVEPRVVRRTYIEPETGLRVRRREVETLGVFLVEGRYAGAYVRSVPAAPGESIVVGADSSFNAVATRSGADSGAPDVALPAPLRRIWASPSPSAWRRRLRVFEDLAVTHLAGGGGARADAAPDEASRGFRRARMPERGEGVDAIVRSLEADLLPFCHDKRAPSYTAHLDVPPADLSIAAGVLIRALAQDPVTWTSSRAGTFVEQEVMRWLAALAFPDALHSAGVACAGGTQANLHAVLLARNLAVPGVERLGVAGAMRREGFRSLRVLASAAAHGSVRAAVRHAGLGDESLVELAVDEGDALRLDALEAALDAAKRAGDKVALVVLHAGTVGVGAIDPLPEAIALARRQGARVHVDAAHGAMLLFSRHHAPRLSGIALADSVTADPHKILGLNQGLGALLLRDAADREAAAKEPAPYFASGVGSTPALSRFSLDGTRPLQALGAWILMKHLGRAGYERIVDHLVSLTARFVEGISRSGSFDLYAPPAMNLVAFRPRGGGDAEIDRVVQRAERARRGLSRYRSARGLFLRAVFVNPATTGREIDGLVRTIGA